MPWLERGSAAGALLEVVTPRTSCSSCTPLFFDKYVNSGIKLGIQNCGVGDFNFWKYLPNVFTLETRLVKNVDVKSSREKKEIQ